MRCVITILVFLLAGLLNNTPANAAENAGRNIADKDIANAIYSILLADNAVSSHLIDIAVSEGVVTLSGSVDNILSRDRAIQLAEMTKGVRAVVNTIEVKPLHRKDERIRKDIQEALHKDPATDAYELEISVNDGIVTLTGIVDSHADKILCTIVVKGTTGVKDVNNNVIYTKITDRSDSEIKAEIERRLYADISINANMIEVAVQGGEVTLSGVVGSAWEKSQARRKSFIKGVDSVDNNNLEVRWWAGEILLRKIELENKTDEDIEMAVAAAFLYDPRVNMFEIDVDAKNGKVKLNGIVDNLKSKREAAEDANNTVGILRVFDYLSVRPVLRPDYELAGDIRDALLRDPYVNRYEITVIARNAKGYLFGAVSNNFEKLRAEDVASRINGVVDIQNNLTIVGNISKSKHDWEILEDVRSQLWWSPSIDENYISVSVRDGVVRLTGVVEDLHEFRTAEQNAIAAGAKRVINKLKIGYGPSASGCPISC